MVSAVNGFIKSAEIDPPSNELPGGRVRVYAFYLPTAKTFRDEVRQQCPEVDLGIAFRPVRKGRPILITPATPEELLDVLRTVTELRPEFAAVVRNSELPESIKHATLELSNVA
jgi:hypothetical protein